MKPGAKKALLVVGVLYAIVVAAMVVALVRKGRPRHGPEVARQVQAALEQVRRQAHEADPEHVRASEITVKEARAVVKELLARPGSIISINYTLAMQCLNFAVMLLILYGVLWDPVLKFLDERREGIRRQLEEAAASREQARRLSEKRRRELEELRRERAEILAQAKDAAEQQRREIVEQARREADRLVAQGAERVSEEVRAARHALQQELADLATRIAARVLKREVRAEDHARVVQEMSEQMTLGGNADGGEAT